MCANSGCLNRIKGKFDWLTSLDCSRCLIRNFLPIFCLVKRMIRIFFITWNGAWFRISWSNISFEYHCRWCICSTVFEELNCYFSYRARCNLTILLKENSYRHFLIFWSTRPVSPTSILIKSPIVDIEDSIIRSGIGIVCSRGKGFRVGRIIACILRDNLISSCQNGYLHLSCQVCS